MFRKDAQFELLYIVQPLHIYTINTIISKIKLQKYELNFVSILVEGKYYLVTLVLFSGSLFIQATKFMLCCYNYVLLHDICKTKGLGNQGQQCYLRCAFNLYTLPPTDERTSR